jgi:biopolymer transport protein ExbB/TolQ
MLFRKNKFAQPTFHTSLAPAVLVGTVTTFVFFGLMELGPLNYAILRRYCTCHPVAYATMGLFFVAFAALTSKIKSLVIQQRLFMRAATSVDEISGSKQDIRSDASGAQKAQWFHTLWLTQPVELTHSWLGQRVSGLLDRQLKRANTKHLDDDIQSLADMDADAQHDSYGLVRIVTWAMPMLGFLGTVLGISDTLGQMDAQALASGSQEAMNSLTAGLYVAFDTTAIGLVMTMVAMFIQFSVNRSELSLLGRIDSKVASTMQLCLTETDIPQDVRYVEQSLRTITTELMASVQLIVERQSELWKMTIGEAHAHWQNLTAGSSQAIEQSLSSAIELAMSTHRAAVTENVEQLAKIQSEGAALIDARWMQWQTTLSEQARSAHHQQSQVLAQIELLNSLIEKNDALQHMEKPLQTTLERLVDVDRFHEVALCMTEAVAVLGTQLERNGVLGRQAARRKAMEQDSTQTELEAVISPDIIPIRKAAATRDSSKRKAG